LLQKFCADDIYNTGETDLFYRAMPDGFRATKTQHCLVERKQRIVQLCCAVPTSQELINGNCWLLGEGLSLCALKGLVWTVYQFCTMLIKKRGWHLKLLRNG
jgi:hypothetical protein